MAFVKRGERESKKPTPKKEKLLFDTWADQAIYAINYLKEEYGIDIYDESRKPAMHINSPNNPNYVGNVGEKISTTGENISEDLMSKLLNSIKQK